MPPRIVLTDGDLARFWPKVDKQGGIPAHDPGLGPCWQWLAGKSHGYGIFYLSTQPPLRSHQISWYLHDLGIVPEGLVIRHRCDNRACVNPTHLVLGTRADNNQDTHDRGRWMYVRPGEGRRRGPPKRKGPTPGPIEPRFWAKVDKFSPAPSHAPDLGGCWFFTGFLDHYGYGRFFMPGSARNSGRSKPKAHRIAYELTHGAIPEGVDVLHRCGVRRCVNPEHLYLGDDKDNARDRRAHGREPNRGGERNGRAKLTPVQVAAIRSRYAAGGISQQALADEFGVRQTTISGIVLGKKWKSL